MGTSTDRLQHDLGPASSCNSLPEVLTMIKTLSMRSEFERSAAAFAILLSARHALGQGSYFEHTCAVLDSMARAKAEIDIAVCHAGRIVEVTSKILRVTQRFLEENTIPCTEWPTPMELVEVVEREAGRFTYA